MGTRYAKFSPENETAAEALAAYLDVQLATVNEGLVSWAARDEGGHLLIDTNSNWVVAWPYDGPFEQGSPPAIIPKPSEVDSYMELAVIVDTPDWPVE